MSPALGLCTFGPFALLFCWLIGYSVTNVLVAWLIFLLGSFIIFSKQQNYPEKQLFLSNCNWLIIAAMFWALIPTINIFPFIYENGLFVNCHIFDHMKIAIIDSIVREGLPPLNPYYAPAGERIPLLYYYAWHFFASLLKLLTGVSGWQAEVAFTWFTSFATIAFLAALVIRLTGKLFSGFLVLLLALAGPPADILPKVIGYRWVEWIGYPKTHPLELLWIQLSWAPQHVFAALNSIVLFFLISHVLQNKHLRWQHAIVIGLTVAAGFSASVWVGGIALLFASPFLIFALWLSSADFSKMATPLLLALTICFIFSIPALTCYTSGPSGSGKVPLAIQYYTSTGLLERETVLEQIGHIIFYWLQFLPLSLGIVYILGVLAILTYRPMKQENRIFVYLSYVGIFTYLIIIQFIKSDIVNNDFAWRSALVPVMLLLIWATTALSEIPNNAINWHKFAIQLNKKQLFVPFAWTGITLGLLSSFFYWHWPKPHPKYNAPNSTKLALHQDLFRLVPAWQALRKYTAPDDLVQSNPDTYSRVLTNSFAPTPLALFGDRPTSFAEQISVNVFAHAYNKQQKKINTPK